MFLFYSFKSKNTIHTREIQLFTLRFALFEMLNSVHMIYKSDFRSLVKYFAPSSSETGQSEAGITSEVKRCVSDAQGPHNLFYLWETLP